jgi:leader peptidase (prepilin peptidase)/N-methyltransferase
MIRTLGTIFAGLLGLAFGSFLNVCLSRWPQGESIVSPRSHCRHCDHTLAWWENIPLVSWLALRGRCRKCRAWIGWRYPLVELAVGVLWAFPVWRLMAEVADPNLPATLIYFELLRSACVLIFLWCLVAMAMLDSENLWLPDWITGGGGVVGFIFSGVWGAVSPWDSTHNGLSAALQSLLAILAAAALILFIRWIYWLVRHREGIGLGDAKLMAMLAAWLGLPGALLAFGLGVVLGAVVAVILLVMPSRRNGAESWAASRLPLGTFLCIGGIVSCLWGQPILAAYLRWTGL